MSAFYSCFENPANYNSYRPELERIAVPRFAARYQQAERLR
jgi:hypothetical protein